MLSVNYYTKKSCHHILYCSIIVALYLLFTEPSFWFCYYGHVIFIGTLYSTVYWQLPLTEVVEPVDFEEYVSSHAPGVEPGPLRQLMEFPQDDLELLHLDKECITLEPPLPEEEEWVQLLMADTTLIL